MRGTIGGVPGDALTPVDLVSLTTAYAQWLKSTGASPKVILGRDGRISGEMVSALVRGTLMACGIDVVDLGLSTTPTVEMAVPHHKAGGGIILTASHNPKQWNALKLLNNKGEFISGEDGKALLDFASQGGDTVYEKVENIGTYVQDDTALQAHIDAILALPLVNRDAIAAKGFSVVLDAVNSTGGIAMPLLLKALGVEVIHELYCIPDGKFAHNPEPLEENLSALIGEVKNKKADLGIAVDPDVDRLALVCEDGSFFGEEYTLVAVADYVLAHTPGSTVSNMSSSRALRDITERFGEKYYTSAVGEVNVVTRMKEVNATIGGEGNGGVIYPALHYGRDAMVGTALLLSHLATSGKSLLQLRQSFPNYFLSKNKIALDENINLDLVLSGIQKRYQDYPMSTEDGVRIDFDKDWVHLRRSNTEPIIRIYTESKSQTTADSLAKKIMQDIRGLLKKQ